MVAPQPWTDSLIKNNSNSNPVERPRRLTRWSILPSSPMSNSRTNQPRSSLEESPMSLATPPLASPASPLSTTPSSRSEKSPKTSTKSENDLKRLSSTMSSTQRHNMKLVQMLQPLNGICVNPSHLLCWGLPSNESTTKVSKSSWNEPSP